MIYEAFETTVVLLQLHVILFLLAFFPYNLYLEKKGSNFWIVDVKWSFIKCETLWSYILQQIIFPKCFPSHVGPPDFHLQTLCPTEKW